ncbi:MAG: terminase [Alphaproteobacteria bacterium]|nr:MAG: terminase [Alphaproteobacteria bacterium]
MGNVKRRSKRQTRATRLIDWIETHCVVPEGKFVGQPIKLRPWQRRELKRIYDNPHGTRRAILSFGRKNGKTALSACLLLAHLVGPEARPNGQLYSAAQSRDQAAILFGLAAKMVRMSPTLWEFVGIRDTAKQLYCPDLGTTYRALSADASTAYGLSPVFVVHDELGQVKGPRSELYEALETATGAQEDPLSIVISTQAPNDGDLLSVLIDDALTGADPRVVVSLYTAGDDLDAFSDKAIKAANPAFGDFQNADEVRAMAADAKRMPAREAEYRNLILNQRVARETPFIARAVWDGCGGTPRPLDGLPVYAGLDLSSVGDLTAFVLVGVDEDGVHHVHPRFWLPGDDLAAKARSDRVPYDVWAQEGLLEAAPGKAVDYEWVAGRIRDALDRYDVRAIGFDRWNWGHFRPWLERAGIDAAVIEGDNAVFRALGQGYQTMSPALRQMEGLLLNKRMRHGKHPVLTMCAANAVVQADPAGNRKLTKAKAKGRIDGMVALAMAVACASEHEEKKAAAVSPWEDPEFALEI